MLNNSLPRCPWEWLPTPELLPGESHGQRSVVGYSPRGWKEQNRTKQPSTEHKVSMANPGTRDCYLIWQKGLCRCD